MDESGRRRRDGRGRRRVLGLTAVVALWSALPPFVGPGLRTAVATEVVDHPVPAVVVLGTVAVFAWWRSASADAWFVGGLVVGLAALWQVATHVPLVVQAVRGGAPWPATVHHALPGVVLVGMAVVWLRTEHDAVVSDEPI